MPKIKPTDSLHVKANSEGEETISKQLNMAKVYRELRVSLMGFAYRYFKKPHEIEDVVQEAFLKVIEAQEKREITFPKSYMFQTVKNLALKRLDKSDYRLTDTLGDMSSNILELETSTMEEQFESQQKFELFCRAVRQLPIKCQRVYILRRVYGFTQKEIAGKMNISLKTVEAHLSKAIVRCTDYMDAEESADSFANYKKQGRYRHG